MPPGPLKYLRLFEYEKGIFPNIRLHYQWIPCYHCEDPACRPSCPNKAIRKDAKFGAVLIDSELCDGCRLCYDACPYGSILFEGDETSAEAQKCDMCIGRVERGEHPICVLSCPTRALDFGLLEALVERYGSERDLEDLPSSAITKPAIVFKSHLPKRQLVSYDAARALELLARRDPLPAVFASPTDVIDVPEGLVGRDELVVKHRSAAELMRCTRNDEG